LPRSCEARHPATRALVLQAIEELVKQVLKIRDVIEGFKLNLKYGGVGSENKWTGGWIYTRAYKEVAKAKLVSNNSSVLGGS
jgi:hypothetical protein